MIRTEILLSTASRAVGQLCPQTIYDHQGLVTCRMRLDTAPEQVESLLKGS